MQPHTGPVLRQSEKAWHIETRWYDEPVHYSGGDTGFEEKEKILEYVKALPGKEYTVIVNEYYNRKNCPPMPVFIFKE